MTNATRGGLLPVLAMMTAATPALWAQEGEVLNEASAVGQMSGPFALDSKINPDPSDLE
jgi:hypothetical protein